MERKNGKQERLPERMRPDGPAAVKGLLQPEGMKRSFPCFAGRGDKFPKSIDFFRPIYYDKVSKILGRSREKQGKKRGKIK